jgi:alkylation response protein AidB-like acyl-CoA dehydrogenase
VDNGLPGIDISKPEDKMGQRGSATNVVNFTDCRIPASALMGKEGQGFKVAVGELAGGRIGVGSLALGIGLAALDYARDYTGEREQFDAKIGSFQGLQWMLADRYTELEAARLLLMQAAWNKEQESQRGLLQRPADHGRRRLYSGVPPGEDGARRAHHQHLRGHQ